MFKHAVTYYEVGSSGFYEPIRSEVFDSGQDALDAAETWAQDRYDRSFRIDRLVPASQTRG